MHKVPSAPELCSDKPASELACRKIPLVLSGLCLLLVVKDLPKGLNMTTILLVIGVVVGTLAVVVLAALLHGAGAYLNSRWRDLKLHR